MASETATYEAAVDDAMDADATEVEAHVTATGTVCTYTDAGSSS